MDVAMLVAHEARSACKGEPDLTKRALKAMRAAQGHWAVTDEEKQFRGAIAALILESEGEDRDRVERSAKALNKLGAMLAALQAGVPVDVEAMAAEQQDTDLLPLRKLWDDAKENGS